MEASRKARCNAVAGSFGSADDPGIAKPVRVGERDARHAEIASAVQPGLLELPRQRSVVESGEVEMGARVRADLPAAVGELPRIVPRKRSELVRVRSSEPVVDPRPGEPLGA